MKRYISNYILINSTQHTNSVLCVDNNGTCSVHRFDVETAATLYVEGAIVVAPASAFAAIEAALLCASSLRKALDAILPLTAASSTESTLIAQVSFSPKIVRKL
ncbi:MAG: hypothetical protein PUD91_03220 [Bacteroidales bacterium]|nr:hypothetical protein [Bacteroidales bacterium]